jgi:murein L,D-transpeptidase YcbB/YkuD
MERWRWLPRDFGQGDQLYVNLPTYRIELRHDRETLAGYNAVIGATDMPTPVLSAPVKQVIANPDWIVPASIVRKSHLRPGGRYEFSTRPDGSVRVRQKPGPGNALGRVKIQFPNKLAIYFHDTPSRGLFGASMRAFSHGCVRVQHIEALASSIVRDPERFETALAGTKTRSFSTARPLRANIVYLTLVPRADGGLADVGDPYKMDAKMAAALDPGARRVTAEVLPEATAPVQTAAPQPSGQPAKSRAARPTSTRWDIDSAPVPSMPMPPPPAPPAAPRLPDPSPAALEAPPEVSVGNAG